MVVQHIYPLFAFLELFYSVENFRISIIRIFKGVILAVIKSGVIDSIIAPTLKMALNRNILLEFCHNKLRKFSEFQAFIF